MSTYVHLLNSKEWSLPYFFFMWKLDYLLYLYSVHLTLSINILKNGLFLVVFFYLQVMVMQRELKDLQPQLVMSAAENAEMMVVIERESKEVEVTREKVGAEEMIANEQAASAQALKDECEADLAEAIPALEAALAALDTLKVRLQLSDNS